ncbi:MAG: Asp23/Gls24 family envelope stress response protein [Eubacteriales bacterium]|nr:Asp23/Gls24 family envelope stress response protein [Eubacteriales bacterium]
MSEELKNNDQFNLNEERAVEPQEEYESTLRFREEVVSKIVGFAVQEIEGILTMSGSFFTSIKESFGQSDKTKGVSVDMEEEGVVVNLEMVLEYGKSAPEVFEQLKQLVGERVNHMTGLKVLAMNVRVVDILTREEFQAKRNKKSKEEEANRVEAEVVEAEPYVAEPEQENHENQGW